MNRRLITPLILCIVLAACSHAPTKETTEAIGALKKIQAGTQVGINYQEYGRLLIEAKAKVNDALPSLAEGKLKEELSGAMDAYADAAHVWSMKIESHLLSNTFDKQLIDKYEIPLKDGFAQPDGALQIIWLHADVHLKQLDTLLKQ